MDFGQPNNTLYVQNLNEKVALKYLIPQLEETFGAHGEVSAVYAKKNLRMRGQAFVVFKDQATARKALEALHGTRLYGKSMIVRFARYKSDVTSKADGTFEIERRRREQDRMERARYPRLTRKQQMAQLAANPMAAMAMPMGAMMASPMAPGMMMPSGDMTLPNKVLYLQNLPPTTTGSPQEAHLTGILKGFPGFVELRLVANRPDLAFAEFETELQAAGARQALDNSELVPSQRISVTFARR